MTLSKFTVGKNLYKMVFRKCLFENSCFKNAAYKGTYMSDNPTSTWKWVVNLPR